MLNIAVIGLGDISRIHLPIIDDHKNANLVAVCDTDDSLKGQIKDIPFYTDYLDMLDNVPIDCVHICLPHHLHYIVTKACVERGIHVLLEKPLANNVDEGSKIVQLEAGNQDVKICISFQNRFNSSFQNLKKMIDSGLYGEVKGIKGLVAWHRPKEYYDIKPWRGKMDYAGGGVMINQSIHTLDFIQLIGGDILTVRGSVDQLNYHGYEVEDTAVAHIQFQNGATGLYFATNTNAVNSSVEFEVITAKGTFTIKDNILSYTSVDGDKEKLAEDYKLPGKKFYYGASHVKLVDSFYSAIINNTNHYIGAKEAQKSMELIEVIRKSSELHQTMNMEVIANE